MLRYLPFVIVLALWVWAFIDCLTTPDEEVRHLPKVVWVIIILLFGEVLLGPIAWLAVGRRRGPLRAAYGPVDPFETAAAGPRRPQGRSLAPDDDPEFLASLKKDNRKHEQMLQQWEADLRRREQELRGQAPAEGTGGEAPEDGEDTRA
ncbi:PLD nuclease N-terminal domain-containing protein [Kitasatospora nipponensis]|uniref:PLD nuclease N-terminal domain-containing protein n=1 Tax=Kitasatospora nipponensis TaxID=258049 RepID=A0ABN1WWP0_9ACTN